MYLIGNWKMHGNRAFVKEHLTSVIEAMQVTDIGEQHQVVHCLPTPYLSEALMLVSDSELAIGAQDCHPEEKGAYTGDVSAAMLKDVGCDYVIVGHSERRAGHGESDVLVAAKVKAARNAALTPVLCVGETQEQRDSGDFLRIILAQLDAVLAENAGLESLIVAYEPVWAIGTGRTPTIEEITDVCDAIHAHIAKHHINASVLYGGSVKAANSADIFSIPSVDGALVGGGSIDAQEWTGIMNTVK